MTKTLHIEVSIHRGEFSSPERAAYDIPHIEWQDLGPSRNPPMDFEPISVHLEEAARATKRERYINMLATNIASFLIDELSKRP